MTNIHLTGTLVQLLYTGLVDWSHVSVVERPRRVVVLVGDLHAVVVVVVAGIVARSPENVLVRLDANGVAHVTCDADLPLVLEI